MAQPSQNYNNFPKTFQYGVYRSLSADWYQTHPWLEYSQTRDTCYLFACRVFSLPDAPKKVTENWKYIKTLAKILVLLLKILPSGVTQSLQTQTEGVFSSYARFVG